MIFKVFLVLSNSGITAFSFANKVVIVQPWKSVVLVASTEDVTILLCSKMEK